MVRTRSTIRSGEPVRAAVVLVSVLSAALVACSPSGRSSRDARSRLGPSGADAAAPSREDGGADGAAPSREDGGADAGAPSAGDADAASDGDTAPEAGSSVRPAAPRGEVLARARLGDGGAELRVEGVDGGYGFRLAGGDDAGVSIEPALRLDGSVPSNLYFGPRCPTVAAGEERYLGRWTGEIARCVTSPEPECVLDARPARAGCPVERAAAGAWEISVFPCGGYRAPLGVARFEIGPTSTPEPDAGVARSPAARGGGEPDAGPEGAGPADAGRAGPEA